MRTTVEIPEGQRQILHSLALKRGYRGYSKLIQEALDFYIQNKKDLKSEKLELLRMKGSWSDTTSREIRKRVCQVRVNWKV